MDAVAISIASLTILVGMVVTLLLFRRRFPAMRGSVIPVDSASEALPRIWNVPHRPVVFVGREAELDDLSRRMRAAQSTVVVQAVHGLGGVGKTTLAIEYANRAAYAYDIVWWIDAEDSDRVPEQLARLAVVAGWTAADTDVTGAAEAALRQLGTTGRWLIIFDNAIRPDHLRPWLPQGPGHILITSRDPGWGQVAEGVRVHQFTRAESMSLLRATLPDLGGVDAEALAAALGDLPLALAQAAAFLEVTGMSPSAYIRELERDPSGILSDPAPGQLGSSLAAAVTMAERRVAEIDLVAAQALRIVAFLAPEPFPADGFLLAAEAGVLPEPLASAARSAHGLRRALSTAVRFGLAQLNADGLLMHRLTQAILRERLTAEHGHLRHTAALVVAAALPPETDSPAYWPRWMVLLPHLLAVDTADEDDAVRLARLRSVRYLLVRGDAATAEHLNAGLLRRWRITLGEDHPDTLLAAHLLADACRDLGRYENARLLDQDTFERRRAVFGADSPPTLASANSLAVDLFLLGRPEQARVLDEQIVAGMRRLMGDDHPDTLVSVGNLARDLSALGRYEEARALDEDVLARRRRVLGEEHPDTLMSASNVARVLSVLGEHRSAREVDEEILAIRRRVLGEDHPDTLVSAANLGVDLQILGDHEAARSLLQEVLLRRRRVLGEQHPDTLATMSDLAVVLGALGDHQQAVRYTESALATRRNLLGDEHPDTLAAANNHAAALRATGAIEQARRLDESTLERRRRVLGESHPDTLASAGNLAIDLQLSAGQRPAEGTPDD
ncbi:FxSxx-COOH system tetratricopeptide repeat protein [Actinoplanes sp. NPDC023936]|uniref:FxSxx-COOH system tetratricopeptide repeat protein n=1 Tax=Actinoplanes sp. NPDC023936 TaxID=3154910 RepID=UPI0033E8476B